MTFLLKRFFSKCVAIGILGILWQCVSQSRLDRVDSSPFLTEAEASGIFDQIELRNRDMEAYNPHEVAHQVAQRPDTLPVEDPNAQDNSSEEISSDEAMLWTQGLAKYFAPIIYLNAGKKKKRYREPYLTANVHDFLEKIGVKYINPESKKETICIPAGGVRKDYKNLYNFDCAGKRFNAKQYDANLQMFVPKEGREEIIRGGASRCYATSKFVDPNRSVASNIREPAFHTSGFAEVSYMFWYPYNGNPVSRNPLLRKIYRSIKGGHHEGDWEHMSFRVRFTPELLDPQAFDPEGVDLLGVHYAAHGQDESVWYKEPASPVNDLLSKNGYKMMDGRYVGFVATQTHATYNRVGQITRFEVDKDGIPKRLRLAGSSHILPSEKTEMGTPIDCRKLLEMLPVTESQWTGRHAWLNFPGRMGSHPGGKAAQPGPSNVVFKSWFYMQDGF